VDLSRYCYLAQRHGVIYRISRPIRRTVIFSLEILEKNNDECILILVIYCKKTASPSGRAVYGRSPAEIVGSNPTGGMDVCLL